MIMAIGMVKTAITGICLGMAALWVQIARIGIMAVVMFAIAMPGGAHNRGSGVMTILISVDQV
jgi:hypothetical protein